MLRLPKVLIALVVSVLLLVTASSAGAATFTTTGSVDAAGTKWQFKPITVTDNGTVTASLSWLTPTAKLQLGLSRKTAAGRWTWITGKQGKQPLTISWPVTPGTWRLAMGAISGASSYTLSATYPSTTPSALTVTLSPATIAADGVSTSQATAIVTDTGGVPMLGALVQFTSSDGGQTIGAVTDNGDGSYSATVTASKNAGTATITATDVSASPTLSGRAALSETSTVPPQVTLTFSRTELSAADHFSKGTCIRDDDGIAPLDTVVAPYVAQNYPNVHLTGSIETSADTGHRALVPPRGRVIRRVVERPDGAAEHGMELHRP